MQFLCTAQYVVFLEETIEAKDEKEAKRILNDHLIKGSVPEMNGEIENIQIENAENAPVMLY